jgi:hypothetical protein
MRSNLILFVLVLEIRTLRRSRDEYDDEDDEGGSRRGVAQRAKATHLISDLCLLYSVTVCGTLHENDTGFHVVSYERRRWPEKRPVKSKKKL